MTNPDAENPGWGCSKSIANRVIPNLFRNLYIISSVDAESSSA